MSVTVQLFQIMCDKIFFYFMMGKGFFNRGLNQLFLRHCNQGNFRSFLPSSDLSPQYPKGPPCDCLGADIYAG